VQAALTGHLVLSTLHTNDATSAITRLLDMGIENYLLSSTVIGVLAQRLVRKLCTLCRESYVPLPELADKLFTSLPGVRVPQLYRAKGCSACHGTGFKGRTTVAELLTVDDGIRKLILGKTDASVIARTATSSGMRAMYRHGLAKALAGETTLEEVLRVAEER
jgi:general secretion pathway protein E